MNNRTARLVLFLTLSAGAAAPGLAGNWPRFRGENGAGLAAEPSNPPAVITDKSIRWRIPLPGVGHSSPAIWDGKVFTTSTDKETAVRTLLCLSADNGSILWKKDFPGKSFKVHVDNLLATATPAVDADAVYVYFITAERVTLAAVDHGGKELWSLDLGPHKSQHGNGCSPILFEQMVIVSHDQDGPTSFVAAYDRKSGREIWLTPHPGVNASSSTPVIYNKDGQHPQLILTGRTEGMVGYDPRTGRKLWQVADAFPKRVVASPVVAGDLVVGNCGEGTKGDVLVAIRPPADGTGLPAVIYKVSGNPPYVPTPFYKDGRLYIWNDTGTVTCLDGPTGNVLWSGKLEKADFYSSPVYANGHLYSLSKKGDLFVLKCSADKLNIVTRHPLGAPTQATISIANDRLYVRTLSEMICIGEK